MVTSAQLTTCDVEPVSTRARPAWQDLLGHAGFSLARLLSGDLDEVPDITATRVWAARECLTKAGARADAVLTLLGKAEKDWTLFETSEFVVATLTTRVLGFEEAVVFGVLTRKAPLREHVAAGVNATCALTSIDT